jgi:hypothetical protein
MVKSIVIWDSDTKQMGSTQQLSLSRIKINSNLIPLTASTYDLGSATSKWSNLYTVNAYIDKLAQDLDANGVNISNVGNLYINGDLTVKGTMTTIDTQNLAIKDNEIVLNDGELGEGVTAGIAGIKVHRGTALPTARIIFDEATDVWKVGLEGSEDEIATKSYVDSINTWETLANKPFETLGAEFTVDINNTLNINSIDFSKINNRVSSSITYESSIVPTADNTYDLGSTTNRFANVYAATVSTSSVNATNASIDTVNSTSATISDVNVTNTMSVQTLPDWTDLM